MSLFRVYAIPAADLTDRARSDEFLAELNADVEQLTEARLHAATQVLPIGDHMVVVVGVQRVTALSGPHGQPMLEPVPFDEVQRLLQEKDAFSRPRPT